MAEPDKSKFVVAPRYGMAGGWDQEKACGVATYYGVPPAEPTVTPVVPQPPFDPYVQPPLRVFRCSKCGCTDVGMEYVPSSALPEHLACHCRRCRYAWKEDTDDQKGKR